MKVNTCFKNMKTLGLPQVPLSSALHFKEGGVLATHPLKKSFLEAVWLVRKTRENERKRELPEHASLKPTFIKIKNSVTMSSLGYYITPDSIQFTKICKSNTITGGESGKKHQKVECGRQFCKGCKN